MNSRFFILPLIFFLSIKGNAQVQFAFFAGAQATSAYYKVNGIQQPTQFKRGYMGGVAVKVEFDNQLYFFPSIYYNLKGYKVTLNNSAFPPGEFAVNNDVTVQTVEIAPLFQVDLNKKPSHLFFRFGASVDYAFSGREKFDTVSLPGVRASIDRSMVFDFTEYGRFTAQANLHFGYETGKGLMVFAFYQHGFGSMNNADGGPKIFHRIIGLSLGWLFGRNPLASDTRKIQNQ